MYGGDRGGKLYFLLLKFIKRKKSLLLGEVSQLILTPIVGGKLSDFHVNLLKTVQTRNQQQRLSALLVFCYVFDVLLLLFNPTLIQTTSSGKIIAKPSSILREMEELHEESGLVCCICREGYKYHPQKVRLLLRFWRNVLSLVVSFSVQTS